jgi:hypothetical protein
MYSESSWISKLIITELEHHPSAEYPPNVGQR